jgi:small subunit ribosomal protein S15
MPVMLSKIKKQRAIKAGQMHPTDTGSPEAQISVKTKRIKELADHLKKHSNDLHSRRGLLGLVAGRRALLNYLAKRYPVRHAAITKKLGL